jgi:riboflavin-specific deaminase-like protein
MEEEEGGLQDLAYTLIQKVPANHATTFVTLSYAQSLDGYIAQKNKRTLISSPQSLILTHAIRASRQAILIGIKTCQIDNPSLTCRRVTKTKDGTKVTNPIPVIIDTLLELDINSKFIKNIDEAHPCPIVFTAGNNLNPKRKMELEKLGVRVFVVEIIQGRLDMRKVMEKLYSLGVWSLMVEGGAKIIQEFIKQGLVDELIVTVAPLYLGALDGVSATGTLDGVATGLEMVETKWSQFGRDAVMSCVIKK